MHSTMLRWKRTLVILFPTLILLLIVLYMRRPAYVDEMTSSTHPRQHLRKFNRERTHKVAVANVKVEAVTSTQSPISETEAPRDAMRVFPNGLKRKIYDESLTVTEDMSPSSAEETFFKYIERTDVECKTSWEEAGWKVCQAKPYLLDPTTCLVYFFGVKNDWSFVDRVSNFSCVVRVFDPIKEEDELPNNPFVRFYHGALIGDYLDQGGVSGRYLGDYIRQLNDVHDTIAYLKFNVEHLEWDILESITSDQSLQNVMQLSFEIHTGEMQSIDSATSVANFTRFWSILENLKDLGFLKWSSELNTDDVYWSKRSETYRSCCYKLFYINTNYLPVSMKRPGETVPSLHTSAALTQAAKQYKAAYQPLAKHFPDVPFLPDPENEIKILKDFAVPKNRSKKIPCRDDDIRLSLKHYAAASRFLAYINTNQVGCPESIELGTGNDTSWSVCVTPPYKLEEDCIVYSFGNLRGWSFDDAVSTEYHCDVYAFDPITVKNPHIRLERISVFPVGLGDDNSTTQGSSVLKERTFHQLLEYFNHTQTIIDILKMDIEYNEWRALETMARDGSLTNVKQLLIEFHTVELFKLKSTNTQFVYYWQVIRNLHKLGFRLWHINQQTNEYQSQKRIHCCYKLHFLNTRFMNHI